MSQDQQTQAADAAATPSELAGASIADRKPPRQRWGPWVAVLVAAALVTLAFPPSDFAWLAWIGYAPLLRAIRQATRPRSSVLLAYVFGVVHFAWLTPWIGKTVTAWSGTSLGWLAWIGLAAVQGLWYALFGFLAWWIVRRTRGDAQLLLLACAWVVVEHFRTLGGLAMPWGLAAYTQYRALTLIQICDITGALGISFIIALVNSALSAFLIPASPSNASDGRLSRMTLRLRNYVADLGVLVLPCLFYAGTLSYGMLTAALPWNGRPVMVSLIQPNFSSVGPRLPRDRIMGRLAAAVNSVAPSAPSLTVWPESTTPEDAVHDLDMRTVFGSFADMTGGFHLVGTAYTDEKGRSRNSAALFGPETGLIGRYDKQQLVPFGEWFPARLLLKPVASIFRIPEDDVVAGGPQDPLKAREMRIGVLICYESIFPALARDRVRRGANVLVSITNDSWAGRSASPRQHFAMSIFRAIETRRTLCAAALTGVTGIVAPNGQATYSEENCPAIATDLIDLREGLTPYARWGDWFPYLCFVLVVYGLWKTSTSPAVQPHAE